MLLTNVQFKRFSQGKFNLSYHKEYLVTSLSNILPDCSILSNKLDKKAVENILINYGCTILKDSTDGVYFSFNYGERQLNGFFFSVFEKNKHTTFNVQISSTYSVPVTSKCGYIAVIGHDESVFELDANSTLVYLSRDITISDSNLKSSEFSIVTNVAALENDEDDDTDSDEDDGAEVLSRYTADYDSNFDEYEEDDFETSAISDSDDD